MSDMRKPARSDMAAVFEGVLWNGIVIADGRPEGGLATLGQRFRVLLSMVRCELADPAG
jgi:hypothetical protein